MDVPRIVKKITFLVVFVNYFPKYLTEMVTLLSIIL